MGKLLQFGELKTVKGIPFSRTHLQRLEDAKKFPHRIVVGDKSIMWDEAEIDTYLEKRKAARDAPPPDPPRRTRQRGEA